MARKRSKDEDQLSLLSIEPSVNVRLQLNQHEWPSQERFPVNRAGIAVRDVVAVDLVESDDFLLCAGYSSIGEVIDLLAVWAHDHPEQGHARLLFGSEPFPSSRASFRDRRHEFDDEVKAYWGDRGISLQHSARVLAVMDLVDQSRVKVRSSAGDMGLHAKIYVGGDAATTGSSNFTGNGLGAQIEANARFERTGSESRRYRELSEIAENYWNISTSWDKEFLDLLRSLLKEVSWQEALARACADLLEGEWADKYLATLVGDRQVLWPSQKVGIAQALWIIENVGSVLIADATGSGKTKMGAHLFKAVRDRMWLTGRVRRDGTALVCPPLLVDAWKNEALKVGVQVQPVSSGVLSQSNQNRHEYEYEIVRNAQLLAVDEAHNFFNRDSNRTRRVRENVADHVLLFTATPINKGATDLLDLVALLGPDNFDDPTIDALERLEQSRSRGNDVLPPEDLDRLRRELSRFMLRRTKSQINAMVDRDPGSFLHAVTGHPCRFPENRSNVYETGETTADVVVANAIRAVAEELTGIGFLPETLVVPEWYRRQYGEEKWVERVLNSTCGLTRYRLLDSMRSSRPRLIEHLLGTDAAVEHFDILTKFKKDPAGGAIPKLDAVAIAGPPDTSALDCDLPHWLVDRTAWSDQVEAERARYQQILELGLQLSDSRERTKRDLILRVVENHRLVLVFDRNLITLATIKDLLADSTKKVELVTGQIPKDKRLSIVSKFAPDSNAQLIALCSDAMNEGVNLQGASALIQTDLPTTLRVIEQRVGRIERMDSRHQEIHVWWPNDTDSFATRSGELLTQRAHESAALLGGNLTIPEEIAGGDPDRIVHVEERIREFQNMTVEDENWDGMQDALEPIRQLVSNENGLVDRATYDAYRNETASVRSYIAAINSAHRWAFLAARAASTNVPRWILVEEADGTWTCEGSVDIIAGRLRELLAADPPRRAVDDSAISWLDRAMQEAAKTERQVLPKRMIRALEQMYDVVGTWEERSRANGNWEIADTWRRLRNLAAESPVVDTQQAVMPDQYAVAERWLRLVAPILEEVRSGGRRRKRYVRLRDIQVRLQKDPMPVEQVVEEFLDVPSAPALGERIAACIISLPD